MYRIDNRLVSCLSCVFLGVLVSFYFFPVEFVGFAGMNTKKVLAVIGLVIWIINLIKEKSISIDRDLFLVHICALLVSVVGVVSVVYNNTNDITYASYIVSMWVWLSAAYAVTSLMRVNHGRLDVELVTHYLVGVCVAQCIIAISADLSPRIQSIVDSIFIPAASREEFGDRLYGVGCALDVAGIKFSAVLLAMTFVMLKQSRFMSRKQLFINIVCFIVISTVGNMISRTTTVGMFMSLFIIIWKTMSLELSRNKTRVFRWLVAVCILLIPIIVYFYTSNARINQNIRFGFEGFFSLVESGEWQVSSNERLKSMVVFPDNIKTWVIGDGYFNGPDTDPNYVGPQMGGFYMWTDIGYLRFIFYFGLVGLVMFTLFFVKTTQTCTKKSPDYAILFWAVLILNLFCWLKVSTDLFVFFAMFLCLGERNETMVDLRIKHETSTYTFR